MAAMQTPIPLRRYLSRQQGREGPVADALPTVVRSRTGAAGEDGAGPGDGTLRTLLGAWNSVQEETGQDSPPSAASLQSLSVRRSQSKCRSRRQILLK